MVDPEPGQGENANGPEKEGAEPPPDKKGENKLQQLKELFSKDLEYVGLFVFSITAVAMILFVAGFNFFPLEGKSPYSHFRSAELLLTLAATGLVVAIIGRANNPFVLTFGIFLIGALIVPSKDIVRFALIASGSDRTYESIIQSARSGTDVEGRSTDVANKILTELDRFGFLNLAENLPPAGRAARRKEAINIVEGEVRKEREITLLEQVRARGALETLNATGADIKGWVYKYGREEKFIEDLRFLRSEGLISYAYDDFDTIVITFLGGNVLGRAAAGSALADLGFDFAGLEPSGYAIPGAPVAACPSDSDIISAPDASTEVLSSGGRSMNLRRDFQYMRFVVSDSATYQIDVVVDDPNLVGPLDPLLALFSLTPENDCTFLATDDDGGNDLNSRLSLQLQSGAYLIGTRTLNPIEGSASVLVKKSGTAG